MSAHDRAPGFRRPQLATPAYTPSPRGSEIPARSRSGRRPVVRRKALFVAAATLCAPALAALALAAIGATGGGGHDAIGSFAGNEGLRGTTTPAVSAPSPDAGKLDAPKEKHTSSDPTASHHLQKHPSQPQAPARPPAHQAPATPAPHVKPAPNTNVNTPTLPTYDPSQPGAPTSSGTTSTTGTSGSGTGTTTSGTSGSGTTGSGTSTTGTSGSGTYGSGSGSRDGSGGSVDGFDAYPGGG
jgi:hypothetical protein